MTMLKPKRRALVTGGVALSALAVLPALAAAGKASAAQGAAPPPAADTPGRLTFHGIDTYHGATIGTLKVDIALLEGANYRIVRTFNTAANGRSDGALFEGETFKRGRYELTLHIGDYYAALGTKLPSPTFISRVPLRFGVADARARYHQ